jgi:hypothetical protein
MNRPGGRVVYCPVCCRILPALTALLLSPAIAVAQSDPEPAQDAGRSYAETISLGGSSGDLRGRAADWMIMPGGMYTLSAGLTFLTAPESPFDGAEMRLTDVVLSSLAARYAIGGRGEIALAVELLPKQPAGADESVWQRAQIGGRVGFGDRYAGWLTLVAGPTLGGDGRWGSGSFGVEAQKSLHPTLVFHGVFGASAISLFDDEMTRTAWFGEVVTGGEMIFRVPNGMAAAWLGTSFHFPVAERSDSIDLDPQTRANISLGAVLSYIESWDISFELSVIDRGEMASPDTTLPILAGGYDQTQVMVGVTRRFREEGRSSTLRIGY